LVQVFAQLVCAIYWFNPLVWYATHRVRIEREHACDDRVLALGTAATEYADHLVQIVRGLRGQRALSFAAVSMAQPSQLETRLVSILDTRASRRPLSKTGAMLLCAFTVAFTVSMAAIGVTEAVSLPPVVVTVMKVASPEPVKPASAAPQRTRIGNGATVPTNAVIPPRVLESSPPSYTPEAVQANVEGTITLEGQVDIKGKVSGLRVIKGLGYGLDQKAIEAVLGWKFGPALRNGAPADAITQIEVDFRIPAWFRAAPNDEVPPISIGPGVTPPKVNFRVEPQYTPEARAAKYHGTVIVSATVHKDGSLTVNEVLQELEYGLTPKAIEALEQWKFDPAKKDGQDVSVSLTVEVNFNLR
jgi:TonB family protein